VWAVPDDRAHGRSARGGVGRPRTRREAEPITASRLNVRSIPMLLVFKRGREVDRIIGVHPKSEIARRVERAIA